MKYLILLFVFSTNIHGNVLSNQQTVEFDTLLKISFFLIIAIFICNIVVSHFFQKKLIQEKKKSLKNKKKQK